MSSLDLAEELEARAAALRAEVHLIDELEAAKQACRDEPTPENRATKQDAAKALHEARAARRGDTVTVGGDAYVTSEED